MGWGQKELNPKSESESEKKKKKNLHGCGPVLSPMGGSEKQISILNIYSDHSVLLKILHPYQKQKKKIFSRRR